MIFTYFFNDFCKQCVKMYKAHKFFSEKISQMALKFEIFRSKVSLWNSCMQLLVPFAATEI